MSTIAVFSGDFCQAEEITQKVLEDTGFTHVTDDEIVACLHDFMAVSSKPEMRQNASATAAKFSMERHMENLLALYARTFKEKRR